MPSVELQERLTVARTELHQRDSVSEEDVRNALISPLLDALGFDSLHRRSEYSDRGNTPDDVIYAHPPGTNPSQYSQIILEAKSLGTNFNTGPSRTETPERQLRRYLRDHQAAGPNTVGVLTDGDKYRIFQRTGNLTDIQYVDEYQIFDDQLTIIPDQVDRLFSLLSQEALASAWPKRRDPFAAARRVCELIADAEASTSQILTDLYAGFEVADRLKEGELNGRTRDACKEDWKLAEWGYGPNYKTDNPRLDGSQRMVIAWLEFKPEEGADVAELKRGDVSLAARAFASKSEDCRTAVIVSRQANSRGEIERARIAIHHRGHTGMTPEFDPHNPPLSVLKSIDSIVKQLGASTPVSGEKLSDAVTVKVIRKEFYDAIAAWTKARQRGRNERDRKSVLRHLIRLVFVWILKEDGIIQPEIFDESFAKRHGKDKHYYHSTLMFMFHERLNKPENEREHHDVKEIDAVLDATPFLNGSLFAEHSGDGLLELSTRHYFGVSVDDPGLFTIMGRYDWTTAEHTPAESDQTIDPEMLSNLFENLFAVSESDEVMDRMPRGTYYTPSDVVAEMVKDALSAASSAFAPPPPPYQQYYKPNLCG